MLTISFLKKTYLINSHLYKELCEIEEEKEEENEEKGIISADYFIDEEETDILKILHTIRFWGIYYIPLSFLKIIRNTENIRSICTIFTPEEFPLKYKIITFNEVNLIDISSVMAFNGYEDCLDYCYKNNYYLSNYTSLSAVRGGKLNCLKYLNEKDLLYKEYICFHAEDYECLKYLHENGCSLIHCNCFEYVKMGNLKCLEYLHKNGFILHTNLYLTAVEYEKFECLRYLCENNCPFNLEVCYIAARKGNLKFLKYLRENGCPWDRNTREVAEIYGNKECLDYINENNCPY